MLLRDKLNMGWIRFSQIGWRSREPNRREFDSGVLSWMDSERLLGAYILIIVNKNITCRMSVRLIYEHSSTDGTCVSPLVRAYIKSAHWALSMYRALFLSNRILCLLSLSLSFPLILYVLCISELSCFRTVYSVLSTCFCHRTLLHSTYRSSYFCISVCINI